MTELAPTDDAGALSPAEEQALAAQATAGLEDEGLTLPMLKLTQQMSAEVANDQVDSGHYVNSLTGADYGDSANLVIAFGPVKGRFLSIRRTGDVYVAVGDVVPSNWPDKYAGQRFDELPDAEETFRERVNNGDVEEWGSGPPIQTTRNYIGYLIEDPDLPVRLSLKSTGSQAAQKINSLLRWTLKAPWHNAITLGAARKTDAQDNVYYVPTASLGEETDADQRQRAIQLANLVGQNLESLRLVGEDADRPAPAPKPDGEAGIDVA